MAFKKYKKKLLEICVEHVQHVNKDWFDQNNECYLHRMDMLDFMLKVKIYAITKQNNNKRREETNTKIKTKSQKFRNIKHM